MKVVGTNRKAAHEYEILNTYEAGMVLDGSEVKSLRQNAVTLSDAYGEIRNGEVYLFNLHISPYKFSSHLMAEPKRKRKLLLKKEEISKMYGSVQQKGNTLIPLKVYFNDRGFAKVSLAICRKKRVYDKKEKILKEESKRSLAKLKRIAK